jgi:hypothetical protein
MEMTKKVIHRTRAELDAGIAEIRSSPKDEGMLHCIVRRPRKFDREVLQEGTLSVEEGLSGDNWTSRSGSKMPDGTPYPDTQITIMNSRAIHLIAVEQSRWPLAGDQLYVDMDLSTDNLPPGTNLAAGDALLEVSAEPHTGCRQFVDRFGMDAMKFVNSHTGKELNLRGIYARVLRAGTIRVGDIVRKVKPA